jgi:hypothetical protein
MNAKNQRYKQIKQRKQQINERILKIQQNQSLKLSQNFHKQTPITRTDPKSKTLISLRNQIEETRESDDRNYNALTFLMSYEPRISWKTGESGEEQNYFKYKDAFELRIEALGHKW